MMYKTMQNDSQISKISISILNDVTSYQLRNSKKKKIGHAPIILKQVCLTKVLRDSLA